MAKGVTPPPGVAHVCYCHTPMRYAWHMQDSYFKDRKWRGVKGGLVDRLMARLRVWDRRTADGVTHFIANSKVVQQRIRDCYGRSSEVIHPPVDTDYYCPLPVPPRGFLPGGIRLRSVQAARSGSAGGVRSFWTAAWWSSGAGQEDRKLRRLAGPALRFLGWQPDAVVRDHLCRCRALLFPGEEDFGIVPVEAQACGTPVIAFGLGGATETIVPLHQGAAEPTGVWFEEQTAGCLAAGMEMFDKHAADFNQHAQAPHQQFNGQRFEKEVFDYLAKVVHGKSDRRRAA